MSPIRLLLADDHPIVVEGLKQILSHDQDLVVAGTVRNGEEALSFVRSETIDVVVLDINMPVMDGITCAKHLKKDFPEIKIIILTMYPQRTFIDKIVSLGVDGCLLKSNTGQELTDAIRRVAGGKSYFDRIRSFNSDQEQVVQYKLSPREIEVIKYIAEGLTSFDIADKLIISEHTVRTHRKNILRKLDAKNSSEVIQFAVSQQLI
ncbi:MAG: response regulator transcription factor [Cyclobacteriaceae bacterium]|nr:response regulator transcription factor [Cyclobacteriaceae bacterium]